MATQTYTGTLIVLECANCHMDFGVSRRFQQDRQDDHKNFYCPAGHYNFYPQKSDEEILRDELDREQRKAARLTANLDQARAEAEHNERRVRGYQGALAKTKKRIAKGKCLACSCTFPDLAAHMAEAHPDFAPETT